MTEKQKKEEKNKEARQERELSPEDIDKLKTAAEQAASKNKPYDAGRLYLQAGDAEKGLKYLDKYATQLEGRKLYKEAGMVYGAMAGINPEYLNKAYSMYHLQAESSRSQDEQEFWQLKADETKMMIKTLEKMKKEKTAKEDERRGKESELADKVAAAAAIIGIIGGVFFLSPNVTGNSIAEIVQASSSVLGALLLTSGIIGAIYFFNKK